MDSIRSSENFAIFWLKPLKKPKINAKKSHTSSNLEKITQKPLKIHIFNPKNRKISDTFNNTLASYNSSLNFVFFGLKAFKMSKINEYKSDIP